MSSDYTAGQVLTAAELNASFDGKVDEADAMISGGQIEGVDHIYITGTAASTSPTTGALTVAGGAGVEGALNVGGNITTAQQLYSSLTTDTTSSSTGAIVTAGGAGIAKSLNVGGSVYSGGTAQGANVLAIGTTNSTSKTTGALQSRGGLGVSLDTYLGGLLNVAGNGTVGGTLGVTGALTAAGLTLSSGLITFADSTTQSTAAVIDSEFGITTTGGTTTVSTANAKANNIFKVSGALTSNAVIQMPAAAKNFTVYNNTTGNYTLTVQAASLTPVVLVGQGAARAIFTDATGAYAVSGNNLIANPNLLWNGSGEFGTQNGWGTGSLSAYTDGTGGRGTFLSNNAALSAATYWGCTPFAIGPSVPLTLSGEIYAVGVTTGYAWFRLVFLNSSQTVISTAAICAATNGNSWTFVSATATTPALTAYVYVQLATEAVGGVVSVASGGVAWRRLKVERGTIYSAYSQESNFPQLLTASSPVITSGSLTFADTTTQSTAGIVNGELATSTTGGTVTITAAQLAANNVLNFTGALTSNVTVTVPATVRNFRVRNNTTGAFTLTVQAAALSPVVVVTQGAAVGIITDTTGAYVVSAPSSGALTAASPVITSGSLTFQDGTLQSTSRGRRNRIDNGCGLINQRGTASFASNSGGAYGGPDRWVCANTGATGGAFSQSQGTMTIAGRSTTCVTQTITTVPTTLSGTNVFAGFSQRIEGYNCFDLLGQNVTLSFWFQASVAGTYTISIRDSAASYSYLGTFTIATAGTPQKVTLTLLMSTSLTIPGGVGVGMSIWVGNVQTGSYQSATLGSWLTGNYLCASTATNWTSTVGNYISISEVQLELGIAATPYDRLHPMEEVAICKRYYQIIYPILFMYASSGANFGQTVGIPDMRQAPGATINSGVTYSSASGLGLTNIGTSAIYVYATSTATGMCAYNASASGIQLSSDL